MQETQKVRGALVGFGFIASQGHLPAYLRARERLNVDIVAVVDPMPSRREEAVRLLGEDVRVFPTLGELLMNGMALDFVDLCSPPAFHVEQSVQALRRGIGVLCEKPIALDLEQGLRIKREALRARAPFMPVHNYRKAPVFLELSRWLRDGAIGELVSVGFQVHRPRHARGVGDWVPDWRRIPSYSGGGIGLDHGSHALPLIEGWMNESVTSISTELSFEGAVWPSSEHLWESRLRFDSGRSAEVRLSWKSGLRRVQCVLHGTRGALWMEEDRLEWHLAEGGLQERVQVASQWNDPSHHEWFESVLELFLSELRADLQGVSGSQRFAGWTDEAEAALRALSVLDAARRSAREWGRWTPVSTPWVAAEGLSMGLA
jgi:predicted dehydrogenase